MLCNRMDGAGTTALRCVREQQNNSTTVGNAWASRMDVPMWFSCLTSTRLLKLYEIWMVRILLVDDAHCTFALLVARLYVYVHTYMCEVVVGGMASTDSL